MNVILIANERKKELLVRFCEAYSGVLKKHNLFSLEETSREVAQVIGCEVVSFLNGRRGGFQQVASRVACNEADLIVFFKDPFAEISEESYEGEIERLCDIHVVPVATNVAAAELMVLGLERGDLDWRMVVNSEGLARLDRLKPADARIAK